ncbi:MAG TPA: hypothetical protein VMO17_11705, partial [Terriglobia bacterium]|nr:hypothetical protein [Terriglobia bacterium]
MTKLTFGRVPWRFIVIQAAILLVLVGFFKFYLPREARRAEKQNTAVREQKILAFFQDSVEKDSTRELKPPTVGAESPLYPERLRTTFSPQDAESALGVPNTMTTDFRGGEHLTWIGTAHQLEAAFNAG